MSGKCVSPDRPWLMPEVIDWMKSVIRPCARVLETGCGGSTAWFASLIGPHGGHLISYEHDPEWFGKIRDAIDVTYSGFPHFAPTKNSEVVDLRYRPRYPNVGMWLDKDERLDFAFIDGRGRVRSILDALPHVNPGGWLVLDDSDRERYEAGKVAAEAASTARIVFRSGPDETTAWRIR